MRHRWLLAAAQPERAHSIAAALGASPLLAQCLINRGQPDADQASAFLTPRLRHLADPNHLPNMPAAVDRLWRARQSDEPVVIFGDYDVDGVTATALLLEVLQPLGWRAVSYLPHRLDEGYGLTDEAVDRCLERSPARLLLAVDCGSTTCDTIARLKTRGVDVIVLDHHQVSSPPPPAVALVNPQLAPPGPDNLQQLCSVGLAFKLAHALVKRGRALGCPLAEQFDLRPLLDLVALGTIADMVPLTGENRVLASAGLARINALQRPGLLALKDVARVPGAIGAWEVGFQIAPRLNAAGRLENAKAALDLLLARDPASAEAGARLLDAQNRERQQIERAIAEEVVAAVRARFQPDTDRVIVEGNLLWHVGVVGIVAARVLNEFYRPTLILGGDGYAWRGSGRSIEGFDLAAALRACDDLLLRHGGHAMAAGLTIRPENLPALRERLNRLARQALDLHDLSPPLRLDAVTPLRELTLERVDELRRLEPRGYTALHGGVSA
ncbi:MAG TPA: single-stranded-DNA-specific exonuclease RecJ, partial [Verrucomicrobiota bacterium]|nr:single-stranded-DNA-specific exonuclease RecJ [Verrucomicrobiota bacterium]